MANRTYTIVCEYAGGTYIQQLKAPNERTAFYEWIKARLDEGIPFSKRSYRSIRKKIVKEELDTTPFDELRNAWCADFVQGETYVSVTVVLTAD